jgi:hypothetical protein
MTTQTNVAATLPAGRNDAMRELGFIGFFPLDLFAVFFIRRS